MKNNKNALFAGAYYTYFVSGMMVIMLGTVMPFLMRDYGIDYKTGGLFVSVSAAGNLLASFVTGFLALRFRRKKTIVALSSLIFLSYLGVIATDTVFILIPLFLLAGLGRGGVSNVNNAIVNDAATGKSAYLNLLHMFYAIGAFILPLMASALIGAGFGWKVVVCVGLVLSLTMVAVYAMLPLDGEPADKKAGKADDVPGAAAPNRAPFYKNVSFYLAGGVLFFYLGTETSVNGWAVTYLIDSGRMADATAQRVFSLFWAVMMIGRLITAYLSARIKKATLVLIQASGAAVMFAVFVNSPNPTVTIAAIVLLGLFFSGIYPTTVSTAGKILKGSDPAMGMLTAAASAGGIAMPFAVGLLAQRLNIMAGMGFVTISAALTAACALALKFRSAE